MSTSANLVLLFGLLEFLLQMYIDLTVVHLLVLVISSRFAQERRVIGYLHEFDQDWDWVQRYICTGNMRT